MLTSVLTAGAVMLTLAGLLTALLVAANVRLAVMTDPRQEAIEAVLPQANCGGCGYPSCAAYAKAVVCGNATVNRCTVGGPPIAQRIADVLGIEVTPNHPFRPVIHCGATAEDRLGQGHYGSLRG